MKKILMAVGVLALAGCAASGSQFQGFEAPQKGYGEVYVYRPSAFVGGGALFIININNEPIGVLRNGGYLHKSAPVGTSFLSASTEVTRTQKISVSEKEPTCVRVKVGMGVFVGHPIFEPVDYETCQFEIKNTKASK